MKRSIKSCDLKLLLHLFQDEARKIVFYDAQSPLEEDCPLDFIQYGDLKSLEQYIQLNATPISIINISKQDISYLYKKKEVRCIIDFQNKIKNNARRYHYIDNPSGGMRWIFPINATAPAFLSLYNGSGWKAKAFRLICQIVFFFGFKKPIISGSFSVKSKGAYLDKILQKETYDNYALFTGTVGPNRKMVLALNNKRKTTHFFKIPLTEQSRKLVQQEQEQLNHLKELNIKNFTYPEASHKSGAVKLSNVADQYARNSTRFEKAHLAALEAMYEKTAHQQPLLTCNIYSDLLDHLDFIEKNKGKKGLPYPRLYKALFQLSEQIEPSTTIVTSLAHGDFTPWNMFISKGKLQVYDWELADEGYPLLYDYFHYLFQTSILIKRLDYNQIKDMILAFAKNKRFIALCKQYDIDWSFYLRLYLIYISSYYIKVYMEQDHLHEQAHWLLKTWQEAMEDCLNPSLKPIH